MKNRGRETRCLPAPAAWGTGLRARASGDGGLLVPLYFIGLDVPQTLAVALSKGTIFGVACGNFAFLWSQRHPHADRPLIDYKTAVFMQGGELMGVVLGVLFNLLLPQARGVPRRVEPAAARPHARVGEGHTAARRERRG